MAYGTVNFVRYQRSYPTSGLVGTGMGDHLRRAYYLGTSALLNNHLVSTIGVDDVSSRSSRGSPGLSGQNPESRKMVVCVYVYV